METGSKNKAMVPDRKKMEEYHFPGGGEYRPIVIMAVSFEEAEKEWEKKREKVEKVTIE